VKFDLVYGKDDPDIQDFCILNLGLPKPPEDGIILGFRSKSKPDGIEGGAYFEKYTGEHGSVTAHWASKRGWLFPEMLSMTFMYVFWDLGCDRMYGEVRASDHWTRRVDEKLGMKEVATLPRYFPDDDLVIYELKRENCRFIPQEVRNGETKSAQRS